MAKIYHDPPDNERFQKLVAMVAHRDEELETFTAWPKSLLFEPKSDACAGFTMTSAVGFKEAHRLYSPRDRKAEFDHADWRFLVRAAGNLARAFACAHSAGHVIGDVNHSSVMFAPDATCRLIDCDSYQISVENTTFPCRVGEPLHSAPELFGLPLQTIRRSPNHDNFGLAVLIFELLFMGRHPFAGTSLGPTEPSLQEKIREFRFAYGPDAAELQVAPPAGSLSLQYLPEEVGQMFSSAFSAAGALPDGRPTARQWVTALDALYDSLVTCSVDPSHAYYIGSPDCPWCRIERETGAALFNIGPAFKPGGSESFDLEAAWRAIESIKPPSEAPEPAHVSDGTKPTEPARRARARRRLEWAAFTLAWLCGAVAMVRYAPADVDGWFLLTLLGAVAAYICYRRRAAMLVEFELRLITAEGNLHRIQERWRLEAGPGRFETLFAELKAKKHELQSLQLTRAQKLSDLARTLEPRTRRKHLERHRIAQHPIEGLNLSRCVTLASFGVESAADVTETKLTAVPGIGQSLCTALLAWRREIESGFHFKPGSGIPDEEIEELDRDLDDRRRLLEGDLASGANALSLTKSQIQTARQDLAEPIQEASRALDQAKADLRAIAGL